MSALAQSISLCGARGQAHYPAREIDRFARSGPIDATSHAVYVHDVAPYCVLPNVPIRDVIARIDRAGEGLALIVDGERKLLATVTDGDIRRALLTGLDLSQPVDALLRTEAGRSQVAPITAPYGTEVVRLLHLMGEHLIRHIPLLDDRGLVVALCLLSHFLREPELPLRAVIMAGGFGKRLLPLTASTPKPMLQVGDRPLLQHTIEQLGQTGIRQIHITTHYLADKIREHIGDGSALGLSVQYSHEIEPLGTAGSLRLLGPAGEDPLLVINGDVLTTIDYRAMLQYHREHDAQATVGVRRYAMTVPYGVVECTGPHVRGIREKPDLCFFFNAGIYLIEPEVRRFIPAGRRTDMTDVIDSMLTAGERVVSFPIHEYWLDIGRLDDYERAQIDITNGSVNRGSERSAPKASPLNGTVLHAP